MDKVSQTIENICDWVNDRLNDSMLIEEVEPTAIMVSALSELVTAKADRELENRVADLEEQVQSQQEIRLKLHTTHTNTDDLVKKYNHKR